MLGNFQACSLRLEVPASAAQIRGSLTQRQQVTRWLWPQRLALGQHEHLHTGLVFVSYVGPLEIQHEVTYLTEASLHVLMAGAIDGVHTWHWGDGWVQSRLEGVSVLPLHLAQSLILFRLQQFLQHPKSRNAAA